MNRQPCFRLPVTPEDVIRHALAAYYRAVGDATAPISDPNPVSWSDPEYFLDNLCDFFQLRMRCEAAKAGHPVDAEHDRLVRWLERPLMRDQHIRDVDPGLWAEMVAVGHGDASPALTTPASRYESDAAPPVPASATHHGDAFSLCPERQELPEQGTANHTQTHEGA